MSRNATFSLSEPVLELVDRLAATFSSKTEVVRRGVLTLNDLITVAAGDAHGTIADIAHRYPDANALTIEVTQAADGQPQATVRIDGTEPADVGARAVVSGDTAYVYLLLTETKAEVLVPVGGDMILARAQFPVGEVAWPPRNQAIFMRLSDAAPQRTPAAAKAEA
jgi:hypothetical protein